MFLRGVVFVVCFLTSRQLRLCAADLCNWSGSGFPAGVDTRMVLQVRLRCTEGSVRWVHPGQALRVVLEPNLSSVKRTSICIKPFRTFGGANLFVERDGTLELLVTDDQRAEHVRCFPAEGPQMPAIYIQMSPLGDGPWSRRRMGFRYELTANRRAATSLDHTTSCRPCDDTELLMAVCNSDFVVRGYIENVLHDLGGHTSLVEVLAARVHWQRSAVFRRHSDPSGSPRPWRGVIRAHLQCGVRPGDGEFLFTGSEHFGEAWLGCAPRYKDFLAVYQTAKASRQILCDFPLD
ncbi:meteorin-like protein [Nerophis lumbriciformis]|uniref:meteorin-like protein n=1 Tax=Nerophis lumbriciformis TaxID=546530 RepID=UPI002AE0835F|nr:meteorin-like protein [Nerophis lumbriciformis]